METPYRGVLRLQEEDVLRVSSIQGVTSGGMASQSSRSNGAGCKLEDQSHELRDCGTTQYWSSMRFSCTASWQSPQKIEISVAAGPYLVHIGLRLVLSHQRRRACHIKVTWVKRCQVNV